MMDLSGDALSVVAVLAVALGLAAAFPREAIGFSASGEVPRTPEASVSIVFLDSVSVARAMRSTRILSRHEDAAASADLLTPELPGARAMPVMPIGFRPPQGSPAVIGGGIPPFLPSRRAVAPTRIVGGKDGDELPFSRNELLKLN